MDFPEFLSKKRINAEAWRQARPEEYARLAAMYAASGEKSFDAQKKFLFNPLRLEFGPPEAPKL